MSDEIDKRLRESADNCIKSYEAWRAKEKDNQARESLQESIHELRKVASRLEIEIAISERGQMTDKPLPIPPHRSSRKPKANGDGGHDESGDDAGNRAEGGNGSGGNGGGGSRKPRGRRQGGKNAG